VRRVLIVSFVLALGACDDETFEAPPQPDLYKVPYDFAMPGSETDGGLDQGVPDLKMPTDLKSGDDLSSPPDA
jgi:hypothetical protein